MKINQVQQRRWEPFNNIGKRTFRTQLERIPQYSSPNKTRRNQSFYMRNTKKMRLEEEKNTEIQRNNRILLQKIRSIMMKGKKNKDYMSEQEILHPKKQLRLTFMKPEKSSSKFAPIPLPDLPKRSKSHLSSILNSQQKYIDGYFDSIRTARQIIRTKVVNKEFQEVQVGKWHVKGLIYDNAVVLRGYDGKKELKKKYPYQKVKYQMQSDYVQWVTDKFDFEL